MLRVEDKDLEFLSILLQRNLPTAFCRFCSKDIDITGGGKKSQDAHVFPDIVKKCVLDSAVCSYVCQQCVVLTVTFVAVKEGNQQLTE